MGSCLQLYSLAETPQLPSPHLGSYIYMSAIDFKSQMASNARTLCRTLWYALRGKSHVCIPFLGMARPQSKFPHSCVCERLIFSQYRSAYFNWDCGCAIPFLGIFVSNFSVLVLCSVESSRITLPDSWISAPYFFL